MVGPRGGSTGRTVTHHLEDAIMYWLVGGPALLGSLIWIFVCLEALVRRPAHRNFLCEEPDFEPGPESTLTVVIAARDEAAHITQSVNSLLEQDLPGLRIVAVDDRSVDDTTGLLERLAADDDRLEVVTIRELPAGWLGKTHALQRGAQRAQSEWILFTDADVLFRPGALRRLMGFAERHGADHVVVGPDDPEPNRRSIGERIFLSMFTMLLILGREPWRLANPRSRAFLGIGAGNLVRRRAFEDIGGFAPIRLSIDDDLRLGQALKWSGWRQIAASGRDCIAVRWQEGLRNLLCGIEKNAYAATELKAWALPLGIGLGSILCVAPHLGVWVGPTWLRAISGAGLIAAVAWYALLQRSTRIPPVYALALPVGQLLLAIAFVRSGWITERQGGVVWRGTHYPLAELRAHLRERRIWMRERWRSRRAPDEASVAAGRSRA